MTGRRTARGTASRQQERPYIPKPSQDKIKKGAPSTGTQYLKDGISVYRHKDGRNRIRFLAWKDGAHFFYYLYVHRGIGFNDDAWACLEKNWNKPDPICEDARKQMSEGIEWKEVMEQGILPGKHPRILAQMVDRENEAAGIQIWDSTAFKIDSAIRSLSVHEDTGAIINWTDPDEGCDLIYDYNPKAEYAMPENLRRSSSNPINPDFYREIVDFEEDVIYVPTYEEMSESYFGGEVEKVGETVEDGDRDLESAPQGSEVEEPRQVEEEPPDDYDPLKGGDCFKKAFGYYEDCVSESCPDYEKCEKGERWTGENCSECGLPLFESSDGIGCALGHIIPNKEEEKPARRSRRVIKK